MSRGVLLVAALSVMACQSPTTEETSDESYDLTFTPADCTAVESHGVFYTVKYASKPDETFEYAWVTEFTTTIANGGKTGAKITAMNLNVQQAAGGIVKPSTTGDKEYFTYTSSPSSNRIEANGGTQNTVFTLYYSLPDKGREALITVNFTLIDDDNVSFYLSDSIRALP